MRNIRLLLTGLLTALTYLTYAQTIELIPNLNENDNGFWGKLGKYSNIRVEYKGALYFNYYTPLQLMQIAKFDGVKITLATSASRQDCFVGPDFIFKDYLYLGICDQQTRTQMAKFDGAKGLTAIPNPYGFEFFSNMSSLNNIEYLCYNDIGKNEFVIGQYDGEKVTIIPNSGFDGDSLIAFNNAIYFDYPKSGKHQLGVYDGEKITSIPNPSIEDVICSIAPLTVFNNALYIDYCYSCTPGTKKGLHQLAKYDGQNIILVPNPDMTYGSDYGITKNLIVYKNKLYLAYINKKRKCQLSFLDGGKISLIPNPNDGDCNKKDAFIVYKDFLFCSYDNTNETSQLAKYDGVKITLIPNLNVKDIGLDGNFVIYNNELYFRYVNSLQKGQLAKFDGSKITIFPNPDDGVGFLGNLRVFSGCLMFDYMNSKSKVQIAKFK